jgi:hypothetical protein
MLPIIEALRVWPDWERCETHEKRTRGQGSAQKIMTQQDDPLGDCQSNGSVHQSNKALPPIIDRAEAEADQDSIEK